VKNDTLSMFYYYTRVTIKSWFQYKVDAVLRSFAVFLEKQRALL